MSHALPPYVSWCAGLLRLLPPALPGKTRLGRLLLRGRLDDGDVRLRDRFGTPLLVPSLREPIAFHLLIDGLYEPELLPLFRRALGPGGCYVDVGANVGALALLAAQQSGPSGQLLAVECSPRIFPYLQANLAASGVVRQRLANVAALDHDVAAVDFYEAPADHFGMGSLAAQFHAAPHPVAGRRLDGLLAEAGTERVDLLKVDVEGFEALVFRGAAGLLGGPHPPLVVFEFCDWAEARASGLAVGAAQELLIELGYRLFTLDAYLAGSTPLGAPLRQGSATIVAERADHQRGQR